MPHCAMLVVLLHMHANDSLSSSALMQVHNFAHVMLLPKLYALPSVLGRMLRICRLTCEGFPQCLKCIVLPHMQCAVLMFYNLKRVDLMLQQYWNSSKPYRHISVPAFAELFKSFKVGKETAERLAQGPDKAALDKENAGVDLLVTKKYALTNGQLFNACWQVRQNPSWSCCACI